MTAPDDGDDTALMLANAVIFIFFIGLFLAGS